MAELLDRVDGLIPLVGGIYTSLLGFGIIKPKMKSKEHEEKFIKFKPIFKISGIFLIFWGLVQLLGLLGHH
ncbi:hypothetical protein CH373_06440 [Leptospira perolatii]|uniref:Uncharacterized protein n=1 Tax=Leptospira perolatii TaxID=2023191 RepID=A0A2M9ZP30_9LEPT|nr:hypothetical protein [Leptospira perolatii]PJZ70899.1 hypothetical protein CH360_05170 [Leptospira perolatii]PJZ73794.1 hypothetical protein CH373_06440 [Leptospira perolatii]